jgi:hypothetical protein
MIAKQELKDGQYYSGRCRNASVAKWDAKRNCFTYMRTKFCDRFAEDINHVDDKNGYDTFIPVAECEPEEHQIV